MSFRVKIFFSYKNVENTNEESLIFETKALLRSLLDPSKRKGDNGRFGVIGGSFEYTGAPFYAGMSIMLGGGDMAHIFCTKDAAIPIKSYSPDLMVHPLLPQINDTEQSEDPKDPYKKLKEWLPRMSGIVVGPGLGRDFNPELFQVLIDTLKNQVIVGDADFFWMLTQYMNSHPGITFKEILDALTKNQNTLVLTPNHLELTRIFKYYLNQDLTLEDIDSIMNVLEKPDGLRYTGYRIDSDIFLKSTKLSALYDQIRDNQNVIFYIKGRCDMIFNNQKLTVVKGIGIPKRCGGQGDINAGLSC